MTNHLPWINFITGKSLFIKVFYEEVMTKGQPQTEIRGDFSW